MILLFAKNPAPPVIKMDLFSKKFKTLDISVLPKLIKLNRERICDREKENCDEERKRSTRTNCYT